MEKFNILDDEAVRQHHQQQMLLPPPPLGIFNNDNDLLPEPQVSHGNDAVDSFSLLADTCSAIMDNGTINTGAIIDIDTAADSDATNDNNVTLVDFAMLLDVFEVLDSPTSTPVSLAVDIVETI
jgi:hypothetical protein